MSIETLVWTNTILLVFIAWRIQQLYREKWMEGYKQGEKEEGLDAD